MFQYRGLHSPKKAGHEEDSTVNQRISDGKTGKKRQILTRRI